MPTSGGNGAISKFFDCNIIILYDIYKNSPWPDFYKLRKRLYGLFRSTRGSLPGVVVARIPGEVGGIGSLPKLKGFRGRDNCICGSPAPSRLDLKLRYERARKNDAKSNNRSISSDKIAKIVD